MPDFSFKIMERLGDGIKNVSKKEEINNQVVVSAVRLIEKKTVKKGSMVLKFKDVSILKSNNVIPTADAATYLVKVYCDLRLNKECFYKPCRHVYMLHIMYMHEANRHVSIV